MAADPRRGRDARGGAAGSAVAGAAHDHSLDLEQAEDVPFGHFWRGMLPFARARLAAAIDATARAPVAPPLTAAFDRWLLARLSHLGAPALFHEFSRGRPAAARLDALAAPGAATHYRRFITSLAADGGAALFEAYPELGRLVTVSIDRWVSASARLVRRLADDRAAIASAFNSGRAVGEVTAVDLPLSDPHNGHQVVASVTFASGLRVAYKPRSVALDAGLARVSAWLDARGVDIGRGPGVLDRGEYGWMTWVVSRPCETREACERYYARLGGLLAVLHLLRGTDVHADNLVGSGEWPVLVDAETLLQPEAVPLAGPEAAPLVFDATVLRTGMLPGWFDAGMAPGRDMSALGGGPATDRDPPREWLDVNTDAMAPAPPPATDAAGQRPPAHEYLAAFEGAFVAAYRALVAGREVVLDVAVPAPATVRVVFRPTHVYEHLLRGSRAPALLADGAARARYFGQLMRPVARVDGSSPQAAMVAAECAQLIDLDVPYFSAAITATDVTGGVPGPVPLLRRSPRVEAQAALDAAGEDDLALQRLLIRGALLAPAAGAGVATPAGRRAGASADPLEAALAIASRLAAEARRDPRGGAYWLGPRFDPRTGRFGFHASGESLYEGAMGTALFLAACDACTGESRFTALADEALTGIRRYLDVAGEAESEWLARRLGVGGGFGTGSLVYGFAALWRLTGRAADLDAARHAMALITPARVAEDRQLDVTGGVAGAILSLLALHHAAGDGTARELAVACGRQLLQQAKPQPDGSLGWHTIADQPVGGFAHGAAGIAVALARLGQAVGEQAFSAAAGRALAFDVAWLRARRAPADGRWCNGAPGHLLAYLDLPAADDAAIELAIETTLNTPAPLDSLCCGDAGRIDACLIAADRLGRPALREKALALAAELADRAASPGGLRCVPPFDALLVHPGLFQGLAGIGWTLLRASGRRPLPSLLLWEAR